MRSSIGTLLTCALFALASSARADKVYLVDGAVIEGKARVAGDKVIIALDAGEITLERSGVDRIEAASTAADRMAELEAKEEPRGIPGWIVLADFCRDEGLRSRELRWLERVIERDPDHHEARERLGYVKDLERGGWIKREELARQRELVEERARAATNERRMAALELETQRIALERERLRLQHERDARDTEARAAEAEPTATPYLLYGGGYAHGARARCDRACRQRPERRGPAFPIPGVRDPRDTSWPISGVKDPSGRERERRRLR